MAKSLNIPFFPTPPEQYSQQYFAEVTRAFSLFANQVRNPGPERATSLTLTTTGENTDRGTLSWDTDAETVGITLGDNVVLQVGFETFLRVKNDTGSTLLNGTAVGYAGVNSELKVAPYVANADARDLDFIGVVTRDMPDQDVGPVTVFGKVRDFDTTGGAEAWVVGDVLYASSTISGALTNVRPTAPDIVVVVGVVLVVSATIGEILVRPQIPIGLDYGSFVTLVDVTPTTINTAEAVPLSSAVLTNGVTLSDSSRMNVSESGFYQVSANLQIVSDSSSSKNIYFWLRKNGSDVDYTTRVFTTDLNNGYMALALNYTISLLADDYVELFWAADSSDVRLETVAATAFAPDAPAVLIKVTQLQL